MAATLSQWIAAARPRTLPMAVAPVVVGSAAAHVLGGFHLGRALLALVVSLALQVGVNYANDYSDGIRGTDDDRVGPFRLTASRLVPAKAVKHAAFACFGVAAVAGLALIALSGAWWAVLVGVAAILAAWYYTGGTKPYGYLGLGEVFVFVFFGLVAVLGTTYTQAGTVDALAWAGAVSCGLISTALLMANNIRDIPTDRQVGKMTLAARIGDGPARASFVAMLAVAVVLPLLFTGAHPWLWLVLLAGVVAVPACRTVLRATERAQLIPVLKATGIVGVVYAVTFALGVVL
ncbi:1,4-dihydroxy-2-naphthoate polyprenyltransferase [Micrococcus flavus]|uniref:1,4-dihydroxy-2-naphthoate octaprenyltransferase n=1 Tax=Micrococcus flavus TaxID=384602 RepID=A0A4Y8X354_9MICC|nr:1,4-dihydroxy-2-naphthoate polyprenyltransferase [Micrococcus flavus]MBB4882068.1 1,4-dihydroxy-2-naphthoate octaprenyltransferase [Micrococcus flavus]TFI02827.1 1,4-dihydroxy-2-naphthoate polyprenyltransferase [Micrococcus flavus]GGK47172.1 1,4-dihydroxy-2-naphthoate octaprenyltransferase [Micrococcus flavus]